ncbi:MAG: hypothetical protein WAM92_04305 [Mycobacterium sp.]
MAGHDIKLDTAQTLREVEAIADTVRSVAVPGPVPQATGDTPIDLALAKVAQTQQANADAWAAALQATIPEQQAKSINAVQMLQSTEQHNSDEIARVPEGPGIQSI